MDAPPRGGDADGRAGGYRHRRLRIHHVQREHPRERVRAAVRDQRHVRRVVRRGDLQFGGRRAGERQRPGSRRRRTRGLHVRTGRRAHRAGRHDRHAGVHRREREPARRHLGRGPVPLPSDGEAVTVGDHNATYATARGQGVVYWEADGVTYAVVGDLPKADLLAVARSVAG
ncbi:DUF4367 domain-containing protein [Halobacteriaceae archaeon GCM10025711]